MQKKTAARGRALSRILALSAMLAGAAGCTTSAPFQLSDAFARPVLVTSFQDQPPARVTGGFGEDSCFACHFGSEENHGDGKLILSGFPERYSPGETYELKVILEHRNAALGGFQLALRHAGDSTKQAGQIEIHPDEQSRAGLLEERGIFFVHHRLAGTQINEGQGIIDWRVLWTAPSYTLDSVVAHISAIAADGDRSQLGDHVYNLELVSEPEQLRRSQSE